MNHETNVDYQRVEFLRMVEESRKNLIGDNPLIEDEAIIWAFDRIKELEYNKSANVKVD